MFLFRFLQTICKKNILNRTILNNIYKYLKFEKKFVSTENQDYFDSLNIKMHFWFHNIVVKTNSIILHYDFESINNAKIVFFGSIFYMRLDYE